MRYQVPQFIEVEDKIFGPLTIKQFLYIAGGAALGFIVWNILPGILAPFVAVPIIALFVSFAFYKYNDRPFIFTVEHGIKYFFGNKLYIWKKEQKTKKKTVAKDLKKDAVVEQMALPKLSDSRLKEIAWSLDINEKI